MSENRDTDGPGVHHRNIHDCETDPTLQLLRTVADLKGVEATAFPQLHQHIGDLVAQLYESPPAAEAGAELTFSYAGYRITLYQDGHAVFREPKQP